MHGNQLPNAAFAEQRRGRGSLSNRSGRYEAEDRTAVDDGWDSWQPDDWEPPSLRTTLTPDASRRVITRNQSPDVPFDRSINPYRGCEHGCVYCFARPTHAWLGLSPGLDFESRLFFKPDAPEQLRAELAAARYRCEPIAMGTNTDPYQPVEREQRVTRRILEVLAACDHPVTIVTKGALIERDLDILAAMAAKNLANVMVSVTTLDRRLARIMEPRASTPAKRLEAVRALSEAGVPCGVLAAPMIPAINDPELESILEASAEHGADCAGYVLLRLPLEIKDLFAEWLESHFPDRKARVMSLVRQTRGGALYDPRWRKRQTGEGPYAKLLARRFEIAAKRLGLSARERTLDCTRFRPPAADGQLSLL
ncbi:MAG: PA0069 family radical SAM protein [Alphaproteobacteria bacterium]|nr:PA0069 family radical SAM protein [Alphaproteobacteria bacterium]